MMQPRVRQSGKQQRHYYGQLHYRKTPSKKYHLHFLIHQTTKLKLKVNSTNVAGPSSSTAVPKPTKAAKKIYKVPYTPLPQSYDDLLKAYPNHPSLKSLKGPWRSAIYYDLLPNTFSIVAILPQALEQLRTWTSSAPPSTPVRPLPPSPTSLRQHLDHLSPSIFSSADPAHPRPRLLAWLAPAPYKYGNTITQPTPLPPIISSLLPTLHASTGIPYNSLLLNKYRGNRQFKVNKQGVVKWVRGGGKESIAFHRDVEPELLDCDILSLSLGQSRTFVMKGLNQEQWEQEAMDTMETNEPLDVTEALQINASIGISETLEAIGTVVGSGSGYNGQSGKGTGREQQMQNTGGVSGGSDEGRYGGQGAKVLHGDGNYKNSECSSESVGVDLLAAQNVRDKEYQRQNISNQLRNVLFAYEQSQKYDCGEWRVDLQDDDGLLMLGGANRYFVHGVPKEINRHIDDDRYNMSFRVVQVKDNPYLQ